MTAPWPELRNGTPVSRPLAGRGSLPLECTRDKFDESFGEEFDSRDLAVVQPGMQF